MIDDKFSSIPFFPEGTVIATGTFDGVHKGHRLIIDKVKELASSLNKKTILFTFWPHPRKVLHPQLPLQLLNTLEEKQSLLKATGVDYVVICPFTESFAKLSAEEFVATYLISKMNLSVLVVGDNHRMGNSQSSSNTNFKDLASKYDFQIHNLSLSGDDQPISSTRIRELILDGEVDKAEDLLSYPYFINGIVHKGSQVGRTIGFPTANIGNIDEAKILPHNGVYAVQVKYNDKLYNGMLNLGMRPTINPDNHLSSMEVHIFDFDEDIYNKPITVYFKKMIRHEISFKDTYHLQQQLVLDKEKSISILKDCDIILK